MTGPEKFNYDAQPVLWQKILLENALDAVVGIDANDHVLDWNHQAERIFGMTRAEALGKKMADLIIPPELREAHARGMQHYMKSGNGPILNRRIELEACRKDGTRFPIELTVIPVPVEGSCQFYSFVRDISESHRAAERLRASERQLKQITGVIPSLISQVDQNERYLFVNQTYEDWFGRPAGEIVGRTMREILGEEAYARAQPSVEKALGGSTARYENQVTTPAGELKIFQSTFVPSGDVESIVPGFVILGHDITELKRVEGELKHSRDQLEVIFQSVADGILVQDRKFNCVYANDRGAVLCGFPNAAELMVAPLAQTIGRFELFDEAGNPFPVDQLPARRVLSGELKNCETVMRTRQNGSGEERWSIVTSRPILDEQDHPKLAVSVFRDVTEQRRAHESLRASEEHSRFLAEASSVLASSLDYETTLSQLASLVVPHQADWCAVDLLDEGGAPRSVAVAHWDPARVVLAGELQKLYPTDWNATTGAPAVMRSGKSELYHEVPNDLLRASAKDERHWEMIQALGIRSAMVVPITVRGRTLGTITLISAESGKLYNLRDLQVAEDLARRAGLAVENARLYAQVDAERKRLEEAVRARDEFLSIASHELKTPLTSLKLQFQMQLRRFNRGDHVLRDEGSISKLLESSNRQVDRLVGLVDDMLDISRIASGRLNLNPEPVELRALILDVLEHFELQLKSEGCEVRFEAGPAVRGNWDRFRIEQVVTNLLTNAIKYAAAKPLELSVNSDGKRARIRVRDRGMGIAAENLDRIFGRFERAVSANAISGLGLGLYISRQIVEAHSGTIHAESEPGKGSTFTVELPV